MYNKILVAKAMKLAKELYDKEGVYSLLYDAMLEYVDIDVVEKKFNGDVYECYLETGRNEAEYQVLEDIINELQRLMDNEKFEINDRTKLFEQLAYEFNLSIS